MLVLDKRILLRWHLLQAEILLLDLGKYESLKYVAILYTEPRKGVCNISQEYPAK